MENNTKDEHKLSMINCQEINMTGVLEVINFNDDQISVKSTYGVINIKGKKLNMKKLNLEETEIIIEGQIFSINYSNKKTKKSLWKKIFKK